MKRTGKIVITLVTVLLLVFTAACAPAVTEEKEVVTEAEVVVTPTPTVEWGIIEIRVTDPPPADVKSAIVYLRNIEVHRVSDNASDNASGWIPIIGAPLSFDLMYPSFDVFGISADVCPSVLNINALIYIYKNDGFGLLNTSPIISPYS